MCNTTRCKQTSSAVICPRDIRLATSRNLTSDVVILSISMYRFDINISNRIVSATSNIHFSIYRNANFLVSRDRFRKS